MNKHIYGNKDSSIVLIQLVDKRDLDTIDLEINKIKELTSTDFCLVLVEVNDWNSELSPWKGKGVFKGEDFGDKASDTLNEVVKLCDDSSKKYILGGYSLAGLFSLWAATQSNKFDSIVACSPSLWFPNFIDYLKDNQIHTNNVYLSLGDKESKSKNPTLATIDNCIKETYKLLKDRNIDSILEYNEGNHFKDHEIRTAKGFAWIIKLVYFKECR